MEVGSKVYIKYLEHEDGMVKEKQTIAKVILKSETYINAEYTIGGKKEIRSIRNENVQEAPYIVDFG